MGVLNSALAAIPQTAIYTPSLVSQSWMLKAQLNRYDPVYQTLKRSSFLMNFTATSPYSANTCSCPQCTRLVSKKTLQCASTNGFYGFCQGVSTGQAKIAICHVLPPSTWDHARVKLMLATIERPWANTSIVFRQWRVPHSHRSLEDGWGGGYHSSTPFKTCQSVIARYHKIRRWQCHSDYTGEYTSLRRWVFLFFSHHCNI